MIAVGRVREIWRYPVKSMRGERLAACEVQKRGLVGDRVFASYDTDGHIGSGKITRRFRPIPALRAHYARSVGDRVAIAAVTGDEIDSNEDAVSKSLGQAITLRREDEIPHHDAAALHLLSNASLEWVSAHAGRTLDAFAFRPNVLFDTDVTWPAEQGWCDRVLAIGAKVRLRITEPTERCVMVNMLAGGGRDDRVLQVIARENGSCLGVYAEVIATGTIRTGDTLTLGT